jgi:hypothetical protein
MKKIIVLAILLVLALSACGAAPSNDVKSEIIGGWISDDKTLTLEFTVEPRIYGHYDKNGIVARMEGETTWVDNNVLLGVWENNPKNWNVKMRGDKMELKSDDGQKLTMSRLNPYPKYSGKINLSAINNGLPDNADVRTIALDPATPTNIYIGLREGGLYKSTNSGASWVAINTGLSSSKPAIFHLAINPSTPNTLYAQVGAPVYISTNGGESWSEINEDQGLNSNTSLIWPWVFDPTSPNILYSTSLVGDRIYKSIDGGSHWNAIPEVLPPDEIADIESMAIDPLNSSILYVGIYDKGIYKSIDGGIKWSEVNNGLTDKKFIVFLFFDPLEPTILYKRSLGSGLYKSIDGGANWSATNIGLYDIDNNVTILVSDPTTPTIQYVVVTGLMLRRTNSSENWQKIVNEELSDTYISCLAVDPTNPSTLYLGTTKGVFIIKLVE